MTPASLPEKLLSRLGYAVFEDAGSGALSPVGAPPEWFARVFGAAAEGGTFRPAECSPFLENFLDDAARAWNAGGRARAESGAWIERGEGGAEVALEAEACVLDGRRILLIVNQQERFVETSSRLQTAREEKLAHERLRREIQTKEILLHCIVHDLSQPLTAIRGCLSLLTMGLPPEKVREVADIADRQTRKQEEMIRDVLKAFSSEMEALQSAGAGRTADLAQAAREVVAEYSAAFGNQGIRLALAPRLDAPGDWRATAEPDRLRRMFTNYLENALRYSPPGSTTTVGVEEDGAFLRAFVDDQGPGLPEGMTAADLFRLFGKGKESGGKAGLGLYFCKITAERWGGHVGCERRSGGGTRFWFQLPRASGGAQSAEPPAAAVVAAAATEASAPSSDPAAEIAGKPVRPLRILLADDLEINCTLLKEMLRGRGHTVEAVESGQAAVAAARQGKFDVILMDVEMPGMDGIEAARTIRASEAGQTERVPILAVTAHSSQEHREQFRRAGMDGYVHKPFARDELFRAVEEAAGSGSTKAQELEVNSGEDAPSPAAPAPPFTAASIVARFGGDKRLARQLAGMFLKDSPQLVRAVEQAAKQNDMEALAHAAHALKSAVGHFGALDARAAAARLEDLGRRGEEKDVKHALAQLAPAVHALRNVLADLAGGRKSARRADRGKARER